MNDETMQMILDRLNYNATAARAKLDRFADKLKESESPSYTLSWADDIFMLASEYDLTVYVIRLINAGESLADIIEDLELKVLAAARSSMSRSTSASQNIADDCRRVILGRLHDMLVREVD